MKKNVAKHNFLNKHRSKEDKRNKPVLLQSAYNIVNCGVAPGGGGGHNQIYVTGEGGLKMFWGENPEPSYKQCYRPKFVGRGALVKMP